MKAKVLSVYSDYYEIKDFLLKYDFITDEQYNDDEYDLLVWLEGDCDKLTYDGNEIYFGEFHTDYKWDGCFVVLTTGDWCDECKAVEEFFNGEEWKMFEGESVEEFESLDREKYDIAYYRGGVGPVYALYYREIE